MKILLIGNKFFGYTDRVYNMMKKSNDVELIYTFSYSYFDRIKKILRVYKDKSIKYYQNRISNLKNEDFDTILIFGGGVKMDIIKLLQYKYTSARFILYLSADMKSYRFNQQYLDLFDKILTYSLNDAKEYNLIYRPWFYSESILLEKTYDVAFIGSIHASRFKILNSIKSSKIISTYYYIFTDFLAYFKTFWKWWKLGKDIHFKGLPYSEYIHVLSQSKAILDIPTDGQTNITTRPIEALATRTKVITTNEHISHYDFYNEENVYIIKDPANLSKLKEWLARPYRVIEREILEKYNLNSWVNDVLY